MTFLLNVLIFLVIGSAAFGAWSAAPYLPTRKTDVARMVKLAGIKPGDRVYDLGCGDGRLVFAAAAAGAEAIGVEVFILPYLYARLQSLWHKNTRILFGDFYNFDLKGADAVFIFLTGKAYPKLAKKLERELKTGARVVVSAWPIDELRNKLVKVDHQERSLPLYLYHL